MEATKVSVHEVKARMDRGDPLVFIDARSPEAWDSSKMKIPDAIRVPVGEVKDRFQDIPQDHPVITYCT